MSEYNMSHTGQELDEAIRKVKEGYVLPTEEININSNVSNMDITNGKTLNVNVPNASPAFVTEAVYPLSSETNYTGVEVPFADGDYFFRKVADTVYQISDFVGTKQVWYENGVVIEEIFIQESEMFSFTDNGSWSVGEGNIIIIQPADVGQPILVPDAGYLVFPEAGTYVWMAKNNDSDYYEELYIAGTYKREVEPQDFDLLVYGDIDLETLQVMYIKDKDWNTVDFAEIEEAVGSRKNVRLLLYCEIGSSTDIFYAYGSIEKFYSNLGIIEFGTTVNVDRGNGDGEQSYYLRTTLKRDNSLSTEITPIGGQDADLVINLLGSGFDCSGHGSLDTEYMSCNWTDVTNTLNKCRNGKNVKVVLKGMYGIHSGGACPIYCDAFSVIADDDTLRVYALLPGWMANSIGICHIILDSSDQHISVIQTRLNEIT